MSATTNTNLIMSEDSMMFESQPLFAPSAVLKKETVSELSATLPTRQDDESTSPFNIHSSVLDSVFSNVLDGNDQLQDHTPMFDELDLIVDGAKVNSKDDWVSLFGNEVGSDHVISFEDEKLADADSAVRDEDYVADLFGEPDSPATMSTESISTKRPYSEVEESFEFAPSKRQTQLFTPNPSSTLPTPLLDGASTKSRTSSHSKKVDHLGCVTYSKKQRTQPLQPVEVETSDPVLMKRAKNTEAARRSRARKMERMSQLESKVEDLIQEKEGLADEVSRLQQLLIANGILF